MLVDNSSNDKNLTRNKNIAHPRSTCFLSNHYSSSIEIYIFEKFSQCYINSSIFRKKSGIQNSFVYNV
jgi:hypothetical protein